MFAHDSRASDFDYHRYHAAHLARFPAAIAQALFDPGDRVAIVTPVWPNVTSIPRILSVEVVRAPLSCSAGVWSLDMDRLLDATRGVRAVIVNSPNNPTGWTMPQAQWDAL